MTSSRFAKQKDSFCSVMDRQIYFPPHTSKNWAFLELKLSNGHSLSGLCTPMRVILKSLCVCLLAWSIENPQESWFWDPKKKVTLLGTHGRQEGMAKLPAPPGPRTQPSHSLPMSRAKPKAALQAQWGYIAQSRDELTFEEGAIVTFISKDESNDGWIVVQTQYGTIGLVPGRYFRMISANDTEDKSDNSNHSNSNNSIENHRLHILEELNETEQVGHVFARIRPRATLPRACTHSAYHSHQLEISTKAEDTGERLQKATGSQAKGGATP